MATFFCPNCFVELSPECAVCPACHTVIVDYLIKTPYEERLIHALRHPESEARMSAVIGLGRLAYAPAVEPLRDLIERWPSDVVQGEQALDSLARIGTPEARLAMQRLAEHHPSSIIQHLAQRLLA